jgi:hypothetical protein
MTNSSGAGCLSSTLYCLGQHDAVGAAAPTAIVWSKQLLRQQAGLASPGIGLEGLLAPQQKASTALLRKLAQLVSCCPAASPRCVAAAAHG